MSLKVVRKMSGAWFAASRALMLVLICANGIGSILTVTPGFACWNAAMILLNAPSSLSLAHVRKLIVSALERVVAAVAVDALPSAPPTATAAPAAPAVMRNSRLV